MKNKLLKTARKLNHKFLTKNIVFSNKILNY